VPGNVSGIAITTIDLFASRTLGTSYPNVGDIGRKIGMCFQARVSSNGCYGIQHCITVEILGRPPKITLPLAPPDCTSRYTSDTVITPTGLPDPGTYGNNCTHLHACWNLKDRATDSSPGSPPPLNSSSQYSQGVAPTVFVIAAVDEDVGETVDVDFLWDSSISTLAMTDPLLVKLSEYTLHPGASCDRQPVEKLYAIDGTCASGQRNLNVTTSYGRVTQPLAPLSTASRNGYNYVTFDADKTICFVATDNQAVKWGRGLNNTVAQCHVVRFRGPPVFIQRTSLGKTGLDSPFLDIDFNGMGNGTATLLVPLSSSLLTYSSFNSSLLPLLLTLHYST